MSCYCRRVILPAVVLGLCLAGRIAAADDEPTAAGQPWFGDFDYSQGFIGVDELSELLEPMPGKETSVKADRNYGNTPVTQRLNGLFRLKAAWQSDSVLRINFDVPDWAKQLRLLFWNGDRGVVLRCYREHLLMWMAYGVTRTGKEPDPDTYVHWAGDAARYTRSKCGTVEIRIQDGKLVLTRGDLMLMCVPFEGLPGEIYLEGNAAVHGLAMLHSPPAPLSLAPARPTVIAERPAKLSWDLSPPRGKSVGAIDRLPDGSVELTASASNDVTRAKALTLPPGLYEYIFEVDAADPGTGVYFAAADGHELANMDFFRDQQTGRMGVALPESWHPPSGVSYVGRPQWLRVVLGAGLAQLSVSPDGVVWSERCPQRSRVAGGACTSIGLYVKTNDKRRGIRLRHLEVRRLDALMSLAAPALLARAPSPAKAKDLADWEQMVADQKPADVSAPAWRCACILRALCENAASLPYDALLGELADVVIGEGADTASTWEALDEICTLSSVIDYHSPAQRYYLRWGKELIRRGTPDGCRMVRNAVFQMPAWTVDAEVFSPALIHHELEELIQAGRWTEAADFCRQTRYWLRLSELPFSYFPWAGELSTTFHLLTWGEAQAARYGQKAGGPGRAAAAQSVRDPLNEHLGKESYNVLGEFEAAMETGAYREAAQTVCNMSASQGLGLVSDVKDPQLFVSLPITIARRMQDVPELRDAMRKHFGELGQLRRREAVADDDPAAVEAITYQFPGTEAAAAAHAWLGDREFSMGRVAQAASHYREALPDLVPAYRHEALARLRLAEALMGRDVGQPVTAPVNLGEVRMSAAEFEQLVGNVREARAKLGDTAGIDRDGADAPFPCPAPGRYEVKPFAHCLPRRRHARRPGRRRSPFRGGR